MDRPVQELDPRVQQVFQRLKVTAQHFRDYDRRLGDRARMPVDKIDWTVTGRLGWPWPFYLLWRIDVDAVDRGLRSGLDKTGAGYCYMLKRSGKLVHFGSSGWAQLPGDGDVPWLFHIPMNVASVSKFVTAMAVIRLLRDLKIPVSSPVVSYLPNYWPRGAGIDIITFENLLRHEAGLGGSLSSPGLADFATAKAQIALGSTGIGTYNYMNVNFTILRVLFATITGAVLPSLEWPGTFRDIIRYLLGLCFDPRLFELCERLRFLALLHRQPRLLVSRRRREGICDAARCSRLVGWGHVL